MPAKVNRGGGQHSSQPHGFGANLHVHSSFSDGGYSAEEMVSAAMGWGFNYLGFADHFSPVPSPWLYPGCYLTTKDIRPYVHHLHELRAQFGERIKIVIGLEIYAIGSTVINLPFGELTGVDFLLFEDMHENRSLVTTLKQVRARLPRMAIGLGHFDFSQTKVDSLIPVLEDLHIFVEINTAYRSYYWNSEETFRQLSNTEILISVGSDAHGLEDIKAVGDAEDFVLRLHLEHKLTELLELLSKGASEHARSRSNPRSSAAA